MARLSINDLNNLSGISNNDIDDLQIQFNKSYTKILNDIRRWYFVYKKKIKQLEYKAGRSLLDDEAVSKEARSLYYNGCLIFDTVDLFDEYIKEYYSILDKLSLYKVKGKVRIMQDLMYKEKAPMVNAVSVCYGLYQEAYERLNKEEYNEG